jgi:hypothetical protein
MTVTTDRTRAWEFGNSWGAVEEFGKLWSAEREWVRPGVIAS